MSRSSWAFVDARVAGVEFLLGNLKPHTASAVLTPGVFTSILSVAMICVALSFVFIFRGS